MHSFKDFIRSCLSMPIELSFIIAFQSEVPLCLKEFSPWITEFVIDLFYNGIVATTSSIIAMLSWCSRKELVETLR